MMPPIAIAMTTCNGAAHVEEQLRSLFAQTVPAAEILVCDDASTDGTAALLRAHAAAGRIRLVENPQRLGVVANFRQAVALCSPDCAVALCDQDDAWEPEKLEKGHVLLRAAETRRPGPAISFSDLCLTGPDGAVLEPSFWSVLNIDPARENLRSLLFGNFITGCTVLMNPPMRRLFDDMPVDCVPMHDAWLGLLAFSLGTYEYTREPLVRYRQHGGNVTAATNQRTGRRQKLLENLEQFRNNGAYLMPQIRMAACFLHQYGDQLSAAHAQQLYDFTRLAEATWVSKKLLSLTARSYRWQRRFKHS